MTLQERYDAIKENARQLGQQHQQAQERLGQIQQNMIRADAQMALLEALLTESATANVPAPESDGA